MNLNELYHHGILGQKWGKRNGPPYPLAPEKHSVAEKEAGWKMSIKKGPSIKYKGGTSGGGAAQSEDDNLKEVEYDPNDPDFAKVDSFDDPEVIRKYQLYEGSEEFLLPHKDGTYALMLEDVKINIPSSVNIKNLGNRMKTLETNLKNYRNKGGKYTNSDYMKFVKQVINGKRPEFYETLNRGYSLRNMSKRNQKNIDIK